jgi:hypothetical protein
MSMFPTIEAVHVPNNQCFTIHGHNGATWGGTRPLRLEVELPDRRVLMQNEHILSLYSRSSLQGSLLQLCKQILYIPPKDK